MGCRCRQTKKNANAQPAGKCRCMSTSAERFRTPDLLFWTLTLMNIILRIPIKPQHNILSFVHLRALLQFAVCNSSTSLNLSHERSTKCIDETARQRPIHISCEAHAEQHSCLQPITPTNPTIASLLHIKFFFEGSFTTDRTVAAHVST